MNKSNYEQFKSPFSLLLYYLLEDKKICSQSELGREVGYSQSSVSAVMLEKINGSEQKRRAIAEFFNFEYDEFLALGTHLMNTIKESGPPSLSIDRIDKIINSKTNGTDGISFGNIERNTIVFETEVDKKHAAIISAFKNKPLAKSINEILIEIEKFGDDELQEVFEDLEIKLSRLTQKKEGQLTQKELTGTDNKTT